MKGAFLITGFSFKNLENAIDFYKIFTFSESADTTLAGITFENISNVSIMDIADLNSVIDRYLFLSMSFNTVIAATGSVLMLNGSLVINIDKRNLKRNKNYSKFIILNVCNQTPVVHLTNRIFLV